MRLIDFFEVAFGNVPEVRILFKVTPGLLLERTQALQAFVQFV